MLQQQGEPLPIPSVTTSTALIPESLTPSFSRRSAAIPNKQGSKAIYTINTQTPGSHANITETRIINLVTGTSTLFSNDPRDKEATWLGKDDLVLWLKDVDFGATEFWIANARDVGQNYVNLKTLSKRASVGSSCTQPARGYCAGRISTKAFHLKLHKLHNQYDDIAIAVACPATSNGSLYNPEAEGLISEVHNAIWYTTLRKKAMSNSTTDLKYITSPTRFLNALRGTGLESPLRSPFGHSTDFDISTSGIVFLAKTESSCATRPANVNVYYIPLKTSTEMSRLRPQIINVKDFKGRSSNPMFSPSGDSVAFLKKRDLADSNDRNRVIVVNKMRNFRIHMAIDDMPTQQSEKDWHLSPYSVAWNNNGQELYVVAVEAGIRRLFKIPATLSSIRTTPEPIMSDSTTPADVRRLRMVFSAPMDISSERSSMCY